MDLEPGDVVVGGLWTVAAILFLASLVSILANVFGWAFLFGPEWLLLLLPLLVAVLVVLALVQRIEGGGILS